MLLSQRVGLVNSAVKFAIVTRNIRTFAFPYRLYRVFGMDQPKVSRACVIRVQYVVKWDVAFCECWFIYWVFWSTVDWCYPWWTSRACIFIKLCELRVALPSTHHSIADVVQPNWGKWWRPVFEAMGSRLLLSAGRSPKEGFHCMFQQQL